jgi:hypothetical protein
MPKSMREKLSIKRQQIEAMEDATRAINNVLANSKLTFNQNQQLVEASNKLHDALNGVEEK